MSRFLEHDDSYHDHWLRVREAKSKRYAKTTFRPSSSPMDTVYSEQFSLPQRRTSLAELAALSHVSGRAISEVKTLVWNGIQHERDSAIAILGDITASILNGHTCSVTSSRSRSSRASIESDGESFAMRNIDRFSVASSEWSLPPRPPSPTPTGPALTDIRIVQESLSPRSPDTSQYTPAKTPQRSLSCTSSRQRAQNLQSSRSFGSLTRLRSWAGSLKRHSSTTVQPRFVRSRSLGMSSEMLGTLPTALEQRSTSRVGFSRSKEFPLATRTSPDADVDSDFSFDPDDTFAEPTLHPPRSMSFHSVIHHVPTDVAKHPRPRPLSEDSVAPVVRFNRNNTLQSLDPLRSSLDDNLTSNTLQQSGGPRESNGVRSRSLSWHRLNSSFNSPPLKRPATAMALPRLPGLLTRSKSKRPATSPGVMTPTPVPKMRPGIEDTSKIGPTRRSEARKAYRKVKKKLGRAASRFVGHLVFIYGVA